jgi:hypothetical protein
MSEGEDYDCVAFWLRGDVLNYTPVQLKELVPADRSASASLEQILDGLRKYGHSDTTEVAIYVNRNLEISLTELAVPSLAIAGVWLYGSMAPDQSKWFLAGNYLGDFAVHEFDYPA